MSDYDRGKYYGKKKILASKDTSGGYGRNYGRRSPNSTQSKESTATDDTPTKVKQPMILMKPREHQDEVTLTSAASKRSSKDQESVPVSIAVPPTSTTEAAAHVAAPEVKQMTHSVKFLEDSVLVHNETLNDYLQENSDFLVVGVVGPQGVGKSTLLNLLAHSSVSADLKKTLFRNNELPKDEEEYGDNFKILNINEFKVRDGEVRNEIFRVQCAEDVETNSCATRGIDAFITHNNRTIFLDCQPINSISVLDELIQSENKRSNLVSEYIPLENSGEIQGLQLTAFLMSVCHVLIVVQDWFFDSNVIRFIQTAEMLKPTHSNPEDELIDHFPHLLMVQNRAHMEDFFPGKFKTMQNMYRILFHKTKLQKDTFMGLSSSRLIPNLNDETCGEPFNIFLVPEYETSPSLTYRGHPTLENIIKKLRANILGTTRNPLTHIQLTEKTWLAYCTKVWENVKKSSFFVEYTKLMP